MESKFKEKVQIELSEQQEVLEFYQTCFQLYCKVSDKNQFYFALEKICPPKYIGSVMDSIERTIQLYRNVQEEKEKQTQKFEKFKEQNLLIYEENRFLFAPEERKILDIIFSSQTYIEAQQMLKTIYSKNQMATFMKNINKKLQDDNMPTKAMCELFQSRVDLKLLYEHDTNYFTLKETIFIKAFLNIHMVYQVFPILENKLSKQSIRTIAASLLKIVKNPNILIAERKDHLSTLKTNYLLFEKNRLLFSPQEQMIMEYVSQVNNLHELYLCCKNQFTISELQDNISQMTNKILVMDQQLKKLCLYVNTIKDMEEIYQANPMRFTEKEHSVIKAMLYSKNEEEVYTKIAHSLKRMSFQRSIDHILTKLMNLKDKNNKLKTKEIKKDIYYIYQPFIPVEFQTAYECLKKIPLDQHIRYPEFSKKYLIVCDYLNKCEQAIANKKSLPKFPSSIKEVQVDKKEQELISLFPGEVKSMLDNSAELSSAERTLLCLFYGIGTTKHSLEQLQQMYSISNRNILKNKIYHLIKKLQYGKKEEHPEINEMKRKLKEKFILGSFQLSKREMKLLDAYYGLTGEKQTIDELASIYHCSKDSILKKIHYASETVLKANSYTNPAIVKALQNISIEPSSDKQIQDREIRALRLPVKQSVYLNMCPLTSSQAKVLDLFYGLSNELTTMSTEEIAMKYQIPVDVLRYYLYETVRYVLNYITEIEFQEQMRQNGNMSEVILEKKLTRN